MKILILRFSSIGDIILTTPVIRNLKTQVENASIHFATKEAYRSLLEANPYVDHVHTLRENLGELIRELRKEDFDWVIDLHHNLRTLRVKWALGVKSSSYNKLNIEKWLMVNWKINKLPALHIVDRYMATVSHLGVVMDNLGLDYFIPENDDVPLDWLPPEFQHGYVAYAIGAQHATKRLPAGRMIELVDKINQPVVLLGGKEDATIGEQVETFFTRTGHGETERILKSLNKKAVVFNGCGKFNLNQSASLVRQSRAVFTHDTGLMHIAAAFGKPVYSIWGNTIPAFGMYPYRTRFTVIENNRVECRPCSKIGYNQCPKGHFKCMNDLVFDFYLPENPS